MAGYQTRLTTDSKGAKHFIFYTTPGAKIESLINSYTKLLNGISITPEEHVRLGKAFGYTNNEIASYVGRLVSELGNVVSEKTDKANEKYYVGPAYKRTKDGRAIYYEAKKLPGDKYELTAINPKTTAKTKAEAPVIVNKQTLDHLFESVNLTVADRVRKGEYRGVTRKYEGEEEEQDTVFEDMVSGRAINDYTKLEVPSDIAKVLEEEEQKGVAYGRQGETAALQGASSCTRNGRSR